MLAQFADIHLPITPGTDCVLINSMMHVIFDEGLEDPEIRRLAGLVEITETDDFNTAFPERRFARVALTASMVLAGTTALARISVALHSHSKPKTAWMTPSPATRAMLPTHVSR